MLFDAGDEMACEGDDFELEFVEHCENAETNLNGDVAEPPLKPMRLKRSLTRPSSFEHEFRIVSCQPYTQQYRSATDALADEPSALRAQILYYLPENWSASYRFTVFEGSYVVCSPPCSADKQAGESSDVVFRLARPTGGWTGASAVRQSGLPQFEMVWPVPLDQMLLDAIREACQQTQSRAKRKPHELPMSTVHQKLRKLSM